MSKKSVMVAFVLSCFAQQTSEASVLAAKPWKWAKAKQNEEDAKMVRALSAASGFAYGKAETSSLFSGLCLKKPEGEMDDETRKAYNRAKKALSRGRDKFTDPKVLAASVDHVAVIFKSIEKLTGAEKRRLRAKLGW